MDGLVGNFFVVTSPSEAAALVVRVPLDAKRAQLAGVIEDALGLVCSGPCAHFSVIWKGDSRPDGLVNPFYAESVTLMEAGLREGTIVRIVPMPCEADEWASRVALADERMLRLFEPRDVRTLAPFSDGRLPAIRDRWESLGSRHS